MDNNKEAAGLVNIIREIVDQKINEHDKTVTCQIESVNSDGTLNVFILPDMSTLISNIINESRYNFKKGDHALLYLINGRVSNSFVVCKYNPKLSDEGWNELRRQITQLGSMGVSIDTTTIEALIKTYELQTKIKIISSAVDLPAIGGNYLYVATSDGKCYIYDVNTSSYITVGMGFNEIHGGNANG